MAFFYASIGILMFSSIALISKHTLLFSKRVYNLDSNTSYLSSRAQQIDKYALGLLDNKDINLGFNQDICYGLKNLISNSGIVDKDNFNYVVYPKTNSLHPQFINSCVLTDGFHRILLKRDPTNFNRIMFSSCVLSKNQYCIFEKNE